MVTFAGNVRNHSRGRRVDYLEYDAYVPMAERKLREIAEEAERRWDCRVAVGIAPAVLEIGEPSVLIAVSCAHRAAAFDACRYVIDTLKQTVPIWKKRSGKTARSGSRVRVRHPYPGHVAEWQAVTVARSADRGVVEQVNDHVGQHHERRGDEHHADNHRHVFLAHGIYGQPSHSGPVEHCLGEDYSAQQCRKVRAGDRDERQQRVPQCVAEQDVARRHALGHGGAHVRLTQRLRHARVRQPGVIGHSGEGESGYRKHEMRGRSRSAAGKR